MTLLEAERTVKEAGLEDGEELSLVWKDRFIEMASWTGLVTEQNLYVRIPAETREIGDHAFEAWFCELLVIFYFGPY